MESTQTMANHVRWHPIYHFVLAPMMLINLIYAVVRLVQDPGWDRGEYVFLAIALVMLTLLARTNALRVQDRVIRLEERLRFEKLLPAELFARSLAFKPSQYIGLRFASDDELEGLVERVADGDLEALKDIKLAVKKWRGDFFRV